MANEGRWVTVNGHHVFVGEDQDINNAIKNNAKKTTKTKPAKGIKNHYNKAKEWEDKIERAESVEDIERIKDDMNTYTRESLNKDSSLDDRDRNHIESRYRDLYSQASRRADSFEGKDTQDKSDTKTATFKNDPSKKDRHSYKNPEEGGRPEYGTTGKSPKRKSPRKK